MRDDESDDGSEKAFGAPGEREATLWTSSSGTKAVRTANHAFSGIMFDVKNVSEWRDLKITEVHVAGALRRVRVYVCFGSHSTAQGGWELVADQHCAESWYEPTRIRFNGDNAPWGIHPGDTCGIYIHSDSPGDDGLRYSSAWRSGALTMTGTAKSSRVARTRRRRRSWAAGGARRAASRVASRTSCPLPTGHPKGTAS